MSQNWRQAIGLIVLFGAMGFAYLWLGYRGVAGMWVGMATMWLMTGLAVRYWMGTDALAERMIPELMRRLKAERDAEESPPHRSQD